MINAYNQTWNCLKDPKAYLDPIKHSFTVNIFQRFQQPEQLYIASDNTLANRKNMLLVEKMYNNIVQNYLYNIGFTIIGGAARAATYIYRERLGKIEIRIR